MSSFINLNNVWLYFYNMILMIWTTCYLPPSLSARCQVTRFRRWEAEMRSCYYGFVSQQPRGVCFRPSPTNSVMSELLTPLGQNLTDFLAFCRRNWGTVLEVVCWTWGWGKRLILILTCWWFHGWHKASEECEHLVIWSKYLLSSVFETWICCIVWYCFSCCSFRGCGGFHPDILTSKAIK